MDLLRAVAFLLAAGSALAAAVSLGGVVDDKLDVFAQFAPVWLTTGLIALAVLAMTGGGRFGLALAVFAILGSAALIAPDVMAGFNRPHVAPESRTLKLIQLNVWDHNRDPAATARWLGQEKADIVVLEELGDRSVPLALADAYPYGTTFAPDCATVILAKTPPSATGVIDWPGLSRRHTGAWAMFGKGADTFAIAGVHYLWPNSAGAPTRAGAQVRRRPCPARQAQPDCRRRLQSKSVVVRTSSPGQGLRDSEDHPWTLHLAGRADLPLASAPAVRDSGD